MGIGGFEWVIIVLVVLLLFGAKRIPELARGLGQGIREFRKASDEIKKEIDRGQKEVLSSTKYNSDDVKKSSSGADNRDTQKAENTTTQTDATGTSESENKG